MTRDNTFCVKPLKRSRKFFFVYVAENHADMIDSISAIPGRPRSKKHDDRLLAACVTVKVTEAEDRWKNLLGILFFHKARIGSGIVAHEISHAAFRYVESQGRHVDHWNRGTVTIDGQECLTANPREELMCDVVEHMTRSFWHEAFKRKLA